MAHRSECGLQVLNQAEIRQSPIPADTAGRMPAAARAAASKLLADGARVERQCEQLDDSTLIVSGRVVETGGEISRCWISIDENSLEGDCSCPERRDCAHLAALLLADPEPARAITGQARARGQMPDRSAAPGASRIIYVLVCDPPGAAVMIETHRMTRQGGKTTFSNYQLVRALRAEQPPYIAAEDLRALRCLAQRPQSDTAGNRARLAPGDSGLLGTLVDRGVLHLAVADGLVVTRGKTAPGRARWKALADGRQRFEIVPAEPGDMLALPLLPPWLLETETGVCRPVRVSGLQPAQADWLMAASPVDPGQADKVAGQMARLAIPSDIPRPAARKITRLPRSTPVAVLVLDRATADAESKLVLARARLKFRYGEAEIDASGDTLLLDDERVARIERDPKTESAARHRLEDLGLVEATELFEDAFDDAHEVRYEYWIARDLHRAGETWARVQGAGDWQFRFDPDFDYRLVTPSRWYGLFDVNTAGTFELELGAELDGQRFPVLDQLLAWLDSVSAGWLKYLLDNDDDAGCLLLRLDATRIARMPSATLRAALTSLVELLEQSDSRPTRLALSRARIAGLGDMLEHWNLAGPDEIVGMVRALASPKALAPMAEPEGLRAELRDYQRRGLAWLQTLARGGFGGILADDMGLGKTLQVLAHILAEKNAGRLDRPCLVVAPTSLLFNWRAEAARFAPQLRVLTLHGPKRKREFVRLDHCDIALTSYALLNRDHARLRARAWHMVALDEAQAIKNPASGVARRARELDAGQRICLTGTPLENHLGELWSLFRFALPGLLGSAREFQRRYRAPIEKHADDLRMQTLRGTVAPFMLRRRKHDAAPELPPVSEIERHVEMQHEQRRLYETVRIAMHDKVRRSIERHGLDKSRVVVLDALLRLRQICCDPRLVRGLDPAGKAGSAKLELLRQMLPGAVEAGRRILVFSQFTSMLTLIEAELAGMGLEFVKLTGRTRQRERPVRRFQEGRVPIFLISLKAGGAGLNLTAADTVIHYDPWWNPAVEDQATGRAHRIGQPERVFSWRLITAGSVEERVMQLQQNKRQLIEGLFAQGHSGAVNTEVLESLFAAHEDPT